MANEDVNAAGSVAVQIRNANPRVAFVGFDSAWADNPRAPGAICSISRVSEKWVSFNPPVPVSFDQAAEFIQPLAKEHSVIIVAIDQPTVVPNPMGARPVDRVADAVIAWLGGGVQPANRSRAGMFDDGAPIWRFLTRINGIQNPERARSAPQWSSALCASRPASRK